MGDEIILVLYASAVIDPLQDDPYPGDGSPFGRHSRRQGVDRAIVSRLRSSWRATSGQADVLVAAVEMDNQWVSVVDGQFSTIDLSSSQRKRLTLVSAYLEDRPVHLFDAWGADHGPVFKRVFYTELLSDLKAPRRSPGRPISAGRCASAGPNTSMAGCARAAMRAPGRDGDVGAGAMRACRISIAGVCVAGQIECGYNKSMVPLLFASCFCTK